MSGDSGRGWGHQGEHQSLQLAKLACLHWRLRKRALAAAHGNSEDLQVIVDLAKTDAEAREFLLSVFYAGLDPEPIALLVKRLSCCCEDDFCADCILASSDIIPSLAIQDLWSRVWPWMQFAHTYRDNLPILKVVADVGGYSQIFFAAMVVLNGLAERVSSDCVAETPGLIRLVVELWDVYLHNLTILSEKYLPALCIPIGAHLNRHLDEVIDAAGGRMGLVALMVKHLDLTAHQNNDALVYALMDKLRPDRPLQDALTRQGLVRSLSRIASFTENTAMFNGCMFIIAECINTTPGPSLISEIIGNGFLDALLKHGRTSSHGGSIADLVAILTRAMVYFSVLSPLQVSIERLNGQLNADTFKDTTLSAAWEDFWKLAEQRLDLLNSYHTKRFSLLHACDNIECGTISNKSDFRRCSGCRTSNYCSAACQTRHWRHGGHRDACAFMGVGQGLLSARDRSFLRLLLHTQYLKYKGHILEEYLDFWRRFPNDEKIVLDIDLSRADGPFHTSFMPAADLAEKWPGGTDCLAHAGNSGGRMQLNVLRVAFGSETYEWMFPLCSATSEILDGVRRIAASELQDVEGEFDAKEDDRERIQGLIDLQVLETHNTGFWISSESFLR
ncbi:hypothetical protein C8R45DRAFT_1222180 [Mycena sanguinolenta]|nr:hypothetical protein C8R45DRAFT_1222180 [Mycena sanguinolenta]